MADNMSESLRAFALEKGLDDDLVMYIVQQALRAAYKKQYGTDSNVTFKTEDGSVVMFSKKNIVEKVKDPAFEISLKEATKYTDMAEIGDELTVEVEPMSLKMMAVHAGKQRALQCLQEIQKDTLYAEYNAKLGEIIIGYFHREVNGNIFVDLGKVEGFLPKKFQSPLDKFGRDGRAGEENRIKALIKEVKKNRHTNIVQLLLSRTCSDFVRRILELEVPEIYNGVIEIKNIVREAGYRTKVIVASTKEGVDPVGSCVGPKGTRIQHVIAELGGEKIDIIEYTENIKGYIARALTPAEIDDVVIVDEEKRSAVAIVNPTQLSLAVGKQGMNVRLANRLVDWNILVKTEEDFKQMDIYSSAVDRAESLFIEDDDSDVISAIHELPGITEEIVATLNNSGITEIQDVIYMTEEQIRSIEGMTDEMVATLLDIIANTVEIEDEEDEEVEEESQVDDEVEDLRCPECDEPIEIGMSECPHCGIGLTFEYYEDDK